MIVHIGITATRNGMSEKQQTRLANVFREHLKAGNQIVLHHGDCIGGDEQADSIARSVGREYPDSVMVTIHPPINDKYRAFCYQESAGDIQYPEKHYIARDHDIVDAVDEMYGGPKDHNKEEFRGSGTWTTIRYARERMKRHKNPYKLEVLARY
jgi:hypothetical protein